MWGFRHSRWHLDEMYVKLNGGDGVVPKRERAMLRFRRMSTLQKFASVHANVQNNFNLERHLVSRKTYKDRRSAALAEWQILAS